MNEKKTSELEETLELMDYIEDPKIKLDRKVDGLLEANGYYDVLKERPITIYNKKGSSEVFVKYGLNDYCFARLKEEKPFIDEIEDFYKKFKKATKISRSDLLISGAVLVGVSVGGIIGSEYLLGYNHDMRGCGIIASLLTSLVLAIFSNQYIEGYNKKGLEKTCKEICYGREALEKAFGG